ncbi:MAG: metal-dependent transcriptional regulator [Anaerolineales bacterium]|nr:metal-dependent transcriptional regulator [Anaerolineales bacterium]MCB8937984.1 metal-dependent transcriptional regulator [Ardenticatenaceae bacterium]
MDNPAILLLIGTVVLTVTAVLLWPEKGVLSRWQQARQMTDRARREDALKHIYKCEQKGRRASVESIAGALNVSTNEVAELLGDMQTHHLLHVHSDNITLTSEGMESALHIIRAHRLWERYLAEQTGFSESEWHSQAELQEHQLTPEAADALAARLGHPTHDPHGDPIPSAAGNYVYHDGQPLNQLPADQPARIVHLEDEPEAVYAQLVAEGLYPGQTVRLIESNSTRIRFWANGNEHVLAPIVARNISVRPLPAVVEEETAVPEKDQSMKLSDLALGKTAEVLRISPNCRGAERRRFMDLGILPGTAITAEMRSPSGEPTAYRIRDAIIALRPNQANYIYVKQA